MGVLNYIRPAIDVSYKFGTSVLLGNVPVRVASSIPVVCANYVVYNSSIYDMKLNAKHTVSQNIVFPTGKEG